MHVRFLVLGMLSISNHREEIVLRPSRSATLLSALLLNYDEIVPVDDLNRAIWGDRLPSTAKSTLQTYISRLRRLFTGYGLPGDLIQTVPSGYRLSVTGSDLDLAQFRELTSVAELESDPRAELRLLTEALSLWRGAPLANVESESLHADAVPRLTVQQLRTAERRFDLQLELGETRRLLPELRTVVGAHPGHERFREQLVELLHRTGRPTEALAECRRAKQYFAETLGVALGPTLLTREAAIAQGDSADDLSYGRGADEVDRPDAHRAGRERVTIPDTVGVASRLPADLPRFVGRRAETDSLVEQLTADRPGPASIVITGPPGVGKSALAVRVAHLVSKAFPGGQYSVRLGGTDDRRPTAEEVVRDLTSIGPDGHGSRGLTWSAATGLRDRSGDGRVLLLLDDALTAEQVLPLLPTAAGAAVLVTSRTTFGELAITRGASVCRIGPLDVADSRELLAALLGVGRVDAEPTAIDDLAGLCSNFPLALRISALWLSLRPRCRIVDYVDAFRIDPLSRLELSDASGISVSKLLQGSLRRLEPRLVDLFLMIGRSGVPEVSIERAALQLGLPVAEVGKLLEMLVEANLLEECAPGKYFIHGIFQSFAGGDVR